MPRRADDTLAPKLVAAAKLSWAASDAAGLSVLVLVSARPTAVALVHAAAILIQAWCAVGALPRPFDAELSCLTLPSAPAIRMAIVAGRAVRANARATWAELSVGAEQAFRCKCTAILAD